MNQMHGSYDISNEDMLYVLATFVVTPVRWLDEYGWRKMTDNEIDRLTHLECDERSEFVAVRVDELCPPLQYRTTLARTDRSASWRGSRRC